MTIAAVERGTGSWNEIEDYEKTRCAWFEGSLSLPGGIPSHETFKRVISALHCAELEKVSNRREAKLTPEAQQSLAADLTAALEAMRAPSI
jgi:hypothetical protein